MSCKCISKEQTQSVRMNFASLWVVDAMTRNENIVLSTLLYKLITVFRLRLSIRLPGLLHQLYRHKLRQGICATLHAP